MSRGTLHVVPQEQATTQPLAQTGWQRVYLGANSPHPCPVTMGLTHQNPHGQSPLIAHSSVEVCFVIAGNGTMVTADSEHLFGPGDVIHIEQGCWHAIRTEAESVEMIYLFPGPEVPATETYGVGA